MSPTPEPRRPRATASAPPLTPESQSPESQSPQSAESRAPESRAAGAGAGSRDRTALRAGRARRGTDAGGRRPRRRGQLLFWALLALLALLMVIAAGDWEALVYPVSSRSPYAWAERDGIPGAVEVRQMRPRVVPRRIGADLVRSIYDGEGRLLAREYTRWENGRRWVEFTPRAPAPLRARLSVDGAR